MSMSDVIPAIVLLVLSAVVVLGTWSLGYWADFTPGPAFAPAWLGAAAAVLAILRLTETRWVGAAAGVEWPSRDALIRILLTMAGLAALPLLSPVLGMVPCVALFIAFFLIVIARRPLIPSLATVAITTGLIYGVFVLWLGTRMPTGILGI